jgi:hypothetical protein
MSLIILSRRPSEASLAKVGIFASFSAMESRFNYFFFLVFDAFLFNDTFLETIRSIKALSIRLSK